MALTAVVLNRPVARVTRTALRSGGTHRACPTHEGWETATVGHAHAHTHRSGPEQHLARRQRVTIINRVLAHYGCRVDDWMGGQYVVSSQRGRSEMVDQLPQVWQVVETIAGRSVDPLAPELLAALRNPA